MADLVLSGNTSGAITLSAPAVAGTNTITLPANTGTVITTSSSGQSIPKAALPTGSVLQVIQANITASTSTTSTSFVTSSLSSSITPTSSTSKILILINGAKTYTSGSGNLLWCNLYKNGSTLGNPASWVPASDANPVGANHSFCYLDSPATTSSTTYTAYYKSATGGTVYFLDPGGSGVYGAVTMTLMEISA